MCKSAERLRAKKRGAGRHPVIVSSWIHAITGPVGTFCQVHQGPEVEKDQDHVVVAEVPEVEKHHWQVVAKSDRDRVAYVDDPSPRLSQHILNALVIFFESAFFGFSLV